MSSRDGRRIFANGWRRSGELVRCPLGPGERSAYFGGIDAEGLSFSHDGKWVAYVPADGSLWKSRVDGSDKQQLTFPPITAALPQWSPDGTRILFARLGPGATVKLLVVRANGGTAQELVPSDTGSQIDGSWSPDGRRLAVGRTISFGQEDRSITIQLADLDSGTLAPIAGSEGLFSPRWSPDGRYLVAMSHDSLRLALYDFSKQAWRPLLTRPGISYPTWSKDGAAVYLDASNDASAQSVERVRVRLADGKAEIVSTYPGLKRINRFLGVWSTQAPDDSILTLRDTSLNEIFALELEE